MKKLIGFMVGLLILSGCASTPSETGKISVYTTFYVMSEFVEIIGGDQVEVHQLVPNGSEAHDYEPKTSDIAGVADADLFVYNSRYMEHYASDIIASANSASLVVVEAASDLDYLTSDQGQDPHTWLSLRNAQQELAKIRDALQEIDSANAAMYQANYDAYITQLDTLDQEYEDRLAQYDNRQILVEHEAFAYLCHDYDITQNSVTGITVEGEATSKQIADTIDLIRESGIAVVFYQEALDSAVVDTIVKETGCEMLPLNTIATVSSEDIAAGANYLSLMQENLENIAYAFEKIN